MQDRLKKLCPVLLAMAVSVWAVSRGVAQNQDSAAHVRNDLVEDNLILADARSNGRPQYRINATIDYDLLTFKSSAQVTVPVKSGDSLGDVVFFIYANAGGVGGDDERRKNIVVDNVSLSGVEVPFTLDGAVLRVKLPQVQSEAFTLKIDYHGIVPRSPAGSGGLTDMMGGMGSLGGDVGGLLGGLGGTTGEQASKPKNVDYGLYTYGNGILSLGSFWYPSLAVRQNGRWDADAPEGLGDVGHSEMSDFEVRFAVPDKVKIAASGNRGVSISSGGSAGRSFTAKNVRDFAVLMSEDYTIRNGFAPRKQVDVAGKMVTVEAYVTNKNAAKADKVIDIAAHALQVYAKRFGQYPYNSFKVVEGPLRAGAGGMEHSGLVTIASMLYGDLGKQLEGLAGSLGVAGLDKAFGDLEGDGAAATGTAADTVNGNPASELLQGILGEQKQVLESMFEMTIAHEVAHQWWAIGVGSDSQRAPFVDESLTNYSAIVYFEDRYGRQAAEKMLDLHLKTAYSMGRMLGGSDVPVNLKTAAYQSSLQYGAIVYGKGALYYDALRRLVGDEIFFSSLREYYGRYNGRLASPRTLVEIMQAKAPGADVRGLYRRWIEEAHGDQDITGGKAMSVEDLLGGLLGGGMGEMMGQE